MAPAGARRFHARGVRTVITRARAQAEAPPAPHCTPTPSWPVPVPWPAPRNEKNPPLCSKHT